MTAPPMATPSGLTPTSRIPRTGSTDDGRRSELPPPAPVTRADVVVSVLLSLSVAAGLWELWRRVGPAGTFIPGLEGHGPDPLAWPRLLALWLPASQALFAVVYAWLARWNPGRGLRRYFVADQGVSLIVALGVAAVLIGLRNHGALRDILGLCYVLAIVAKTAILLGAVWRWLIVVSPGPRPATVAVFLGGLLPYLFLSAHVVTALSATGDEPYYLLVTHSLVHDRNLDLADNIARSDYLPFYWGRLTTRTPGIQTTDTGQVYARAFQGLQPVWLAPGYWAAGRAGAVATVNLTSALALALAFRLALLAGASVRAAALAWLGAAFSVPIVSFAGSPWPEMTGACLATTAAFLLLREPRTRGGLAVVGSLLGLVVLTKTRLFLVAVPMMAGFVRRAGWRAIAGLSVAAGAAFAVGSVYDAFAQGGQVMRRIREGGLLRLLEWLLNWTIWAPGEYRGHLGLLLDQEFGLLLSAPAFALALAGAVAAARERRWRLLLVTVGPFALTWYFLGALALSRTVAGQHWHGGFSPPGRFVAATLPLLAISGATMLDRLRTRLAWGIVAALYTVTLGLTVLVLVRPVWRFHRGIGRATWLAALFERTGLDAGRLLPSYVSPGGASVASGLGALALIALAGWLAARRAGTAPPWGAWLLGAGAAAALALALPATLWIHPAGDYPAVLGSGRGGTPFHGILQVDTGTGATARERLVWAAQQPGVIELAPRLRPGSYRVTVSAGAQGHPDGPTLRIQLPGGARDPVPMAVADPPAWRERDYVAEVTWAGGRLPVRVELAGVSGGPVARLAYVRAIRITALPSHAESSTRFAHGVSW